MPRTLEVWLDRERVGTLRQAADGRLAFGYHAEWLAQNPTRGLSQSLPPRAEPYEEKQCRPFFAGLLPEEMPRRQIARAVHVSVENDFALLDELGGECAGAVTLLPPGSEPVVAPLEYRDLTEEELAVLVRDLPMRPLLVGEEGVRISLAGAQNKLAIRIHEGRYSLPLNGSPSTHILKPPIRDLADTVQNEAFCMKLARQLGLRVAPVEILWLDGSPCLAVERYDRHSDAQGRTQRLHQEDFCQALGVVPRQKYEKEGGPSLQDCFAIARRTSLPADAVLRLLDAVAFNFLIGNNDAHAKNFSLLYRDSSSELAPLYDLLSTAVYPHLYRHMAMKIGRASLPHDVKRDDWETMAREAGLGGAAVRRRALELASRAPVAARAVADEMDANAEGAPVVQAIVQTIRDRAARLEAELG